jgi:hypothetical protein
MKRLITQIAITVISFVFVALHLMHPDLKVDAATLVLLALAVLPWLGFVFQSIEIPGYGKVEYRDLEKATQDADRVGLLSPEPEPSTLRDSAVYVRIADEDPNLALAGLRIQIENKLRKIAASKGIDAEKKGLGQLLSVLSREGALTNEEQSVLRDLVGLLNLAVHGAEVDKQTANWAMDVGPRLLSGLECAGPTVERVQTGTSQFTKNGAGSIPRSESVEGKFVPFHHRRARTPAGSHPSGTSVARYKSDHRASHLLSQMKAREGTRKKKSLRGDASLRSGRPLGRALAAESLRGGPSTRQPRSG